MKSNASTVEKYLKELPDDRKEAISIVRKTILNNLPEGYDEVINWGHITYEVPLETYRYVQWKTADVCSFGVPEELHVSLSHGLLYGSRCEE